MIGRLLFILLCWACLTVSLAASRRASAARELWAHREYVVKSETGRYRLDVVRVFREVDLARYRLREDGKTVWTGERPFFLKDAVVSEKGEVAGYAHTHSGEAFGNLEVIVIDTHGTVRSRWATPKEFSRFPDGPMNPTGFSVTLAKDPDRVVVEVGENDLEIPRKRLWIYRLDGTGGVSKLQFRSAFKYPDATGELVATREVPGTSLLLCQWETNYYLARYGETIGTRFQLYDPEGALVWSLNAPSPAYRITADEEMWERDREKRKGGIFLPSKVAGQFRLDLLAQKLEVTYQARRTNDEWTVNEVSRKRHHSGNLEKRRKR